MLAIPEIGQWSVKTNLIAAHGLFLSILSRYSFPIGNGMNIVNVSARLRTFGERVPSFDTPMSAWH
jgi:hypothetical protein